MRCLLNHDNLVDSATVTYQLGNMVKRGPEPEEGEPDDRPERFEQVISNAVEITGSEYESWGQSGDINGEVYVIVAAKINVTLVA